MKAGRMETMINGLAYKIKKHPLSTAITNSQSVLKHMRRQRKKLIREALEAWRDERWTTYKEGEQEGLAKATLGCIYSD